MPDESINCCVTSPPYWGLRDYGTASWEGGDEGCDHDGTNAGKTTAMKGRAHQQEHSMCAVCRKCGAKRIDKQIGLEGMPNEYVANVVAVFEAVWRVLRDDGTVWLNLGDSYANSGVKDSTKVGGFTGARIRSGAKGIMDSRPRETPPGLKPKDLVGIPWRVAFALRDAGWYLRQEIIWSKPNPMPESVTDRCTKAHEYIFLLSKSARYYYDADAIKERSITKPHRPGWSTSMSDRNDRQAGNEANNREWGNGKSNKRSVWTVPTEPYPKAHFATFPPDLIEPCILAGCPKGGVVLDPFVGSGTTLLVAKRNGRAGVGIELNEEYIPLIKGRLRESSLGLSL